MSPINIEAALKSASRLLADVVRGAVDAANEQLSRVERVKRFAMFDDASSQAIEGMDLSLSLNVAAYK